MYQLEVSLNQHCATIKTSSASIQAIRDELSHPIEVEAFGPQIFLSLLGKVSQVSLILKDQENNQIDHEKYDLKF